MYDLGYSCVVSKRRAAFTLIELLVVIAIIGTLMALLVPAVRRSGRICASACQNNLKQLALAAAHYDCVNGQLPSGYLATPAKSKLITPRPTAPMGVLPSCCPISTRCRSTKP